MGVGFQMHTEATVLAKKLIFIYFPCVYRLYIAYCFHVYFIEIYHGCICVVGSSICLIVINPHFVVGSDAES